MKFKIAVVGCGRISEKHLSIISSELVEELSLVGVCDVDPEKASIAGRKYCCPAFYSIEQMLETTVPDVVVILTESGNHAKHMMRALTYPLKALICEKPLCLNLNEANSIITLAESKNIELFLVKQNRLNPPVVKMFEALKTEKLGKLILGSIRVRWCRTERYYDQASWRGTWKLDGGALTNQASHHIDLLLEAMGPVLSVKAYSDKMLAKIEAEDTLVAIVKFLNGALGTIEITTATRPVDLEGSISVLGSSGTIEVGGFAVNEMKTWAVESETLTASELSKLNETPPNVYGYSHLRFYKNVLTDLKRGLRCATRGKDGLKSLELIHAIYQSVESNKEVFVGEDYNLSKLGKSDH